MEFRGECNSMKEKSPGQMSFFPACSFNYPADYFSNKGLFRSKHHWFRYKSVAVNKKRTSLALKRSLCRVFGRFWRVGCQRFFFHTSSRRNLLSVPRYVHSIFSIVKNWGLWWGTLFSWANSLCLWPVTSSLFIRSWTECTLLIIPFRVLIYSPSSFQKFFFLCHSNTAQYRGVLDRLNHFF